MTDISSGTDCRLLEDLIAAPSPSGYEQPAQDVFRRFCREVVGADVRTDVMGNVIATLNGSGSPSVMLAGHVDEIGFIVAGVHRDGYVYFEPIGGHDSAVVVGQRVVVHTAARGPLAGTVGRKPVHNIKPEERGRAGDIADMIIDVGSRKGCDVSDFVQPGDPITFAAPFERLIGDLAVSHAFDNKTGAFVVAETLRLLAGRAFSAAVHGVSTVQEEVGLRGARTAGYGLAAQVGIAIDVCHATDYPGAGRRDGVPPIRCGGGPVLTRGANINPEVFNRLVAAAAAEDVHIQLNAAPGGTGTDANALQINQAGMATGLVNIPLRFMHTPGEVVALDDLAGCARILARFITDLTADVDFTPSLDNLRAPKVDSPAAPAESDAPAG